ncbi:MAG: ISAzo13 family transposase [Vallitaleaceae bacterium]|nr:ISAzo13 family transposase [Vallitaleaceae bacterium]
MQTDKELKESQIREKYLTLKDYLDERTMRIWAATEIKQIGKFGKTIVKRATGMDYKTLNKGLQESEQSALLNSDRIRRKGGGRKKTFEKDKTLTSDIEVLVESATRGDPCCSLLWTSKSTYAIADQLNKDQYRAGRKIVGRVLHSLDYSLQANKKTREGSGHVDRDKQFEYITEKVKLFQAQNKPVISIDTKKKENIGNYKNNGKEYRTKGNPREVEAYDFIDKNKGKVAPYGVYDITLNKGWVSVGINHDTAQFAVNSIRNWWYEMGKESYWDASEIFINADGGGSNGYRIRLWKTDPIAIGLQKLSDELGKSIHVSHFPPATSKWNKIEHKMFCFISANWKARPLIDRATVVNLIANTKTKSGLTIKAKLDETIYQKGIKVSDEELEKVNITRSDFHGEWNYTIHPRKN